MEKSGQTFLELRDNGVEKSTILMDWCIFWNIADSVLVGPMIAGQYVPTLTNGHKLWVATKRMKLQILVVKMSSLFRIDGLSLNRVRSKVHYYWNEQQGRFESGLRSILG